MCSATRFYAAALNCSSLTIKTTFTNSKRHDVGPLDSESFGKSGISDPVANFANSLSISGAEPKRIAQEEHDDEAGRLLPTANRNDPLYDGVNSVSCTFGHDHVKTKRLPPCLTYCLETTCIVSRAHVVFTLATKFFLR